MVENIKPFLNTVLSESFLIIVREIISIDTRSNKLKKEVIQIKTIPFFQEIFDKAANEIYKIYSSENTNFITHPTLKQLFDSTRFEFRRCVDNAIQFYEKASSHNVQFAYGIAIFNKAPIFHAWNVFNENIVDGSILFGEIKLSEQSIDNAEYSKQIVNLYRQDLFNHQKFIFGKPPKDIWYLEVGNDISNAVQMQIDFHDAFKNYFPAPIQGTAIARKVWAELGMPLE